MDGGSKNNDDDNESMKNPSTSLVDDGVVSDLKCGFDLNVCDGFNEGEEKAKKTNVYNIDLNMDADNEFEESKDRFAAKTERCFDLNMGLLDENDSKEGPEAHFGANVTCSNVGGDLCSDKSRMSNSISSWMGSNREVIPEDQLKVCTPPVCENGGDSASPQTERTVQRRKRLADGGHSSIETTLRRSRRRLAKGDVSSVRVVEKISEGACGDVDGKDLMDLEGRYCDNDVLLDHGYQGNSGSTPGRRKRRKKIDLLNNGSSAGKTLSRRTSRRVAASLYADTETQSCDAVEPFTVTSCQQSEECSVFQQKPMLPPSSEILNLDGIPILSLFSVYTCLRSFSTLLFLSPFDLDDFVEALKSENGSILFDSIHVSLLQTLRRQMELLPDENMLSASKCLRNLNWDLLDSVTWPIYLVDYLLTHGFAQTAGLDLSKMKLFESDYYKQAVSVKTEILRCLCDDVIDVDAIRLELNRRTLGSDLNMDIDRNLKIERSKRRRSSMDALGGSCLTEEVADETADWNSDECCLCKMDGSLICCDGCPAAYHMKCVGVSSNSLPDGDWYCPECLVDKDKPWLKMGKSIRGAEILGVDPYGMVYYLSAGYLLVWDSCESESSCYYYHRNDCTAVIEALKSSGPLYKPILIAISKQFDIYVSPDRTRRKLDSLNLDVCSELMKEQISVSSVLQQHVAPVKSCSGDETLDQRNPEENSAAAQYSGSIECCDNLAKPTRIENLLSSSEGSVETSQALGGQKLPMTETVFLKKSVASSNDLGTLDTAMRDMSTSSANLYGELGKSNQPSPLTKVKQGEGLQGQPRDRYINCYSFARTSSMVVEDLTRKPVDKSTESSAKSVEYMISAQLKAISKRSTKSIWPTFQNHGADAKREKCGWCFTCRAQDTENSSGDCLFNVNLPNQQGLDNELAGLYLQQSMKGHFVDVLGYILCMEDRLRGLLLGPWLNPHYTKVWRENVVQASDVASLKYFLLMLEANLHRLALTPEWIKHVDSVTTMGSASHIVIGSSHVSSKHGIGSKGAQRSNNAGGLGLLWWRGGRLSRKLFNWKVLPRALASKAARQAGCSMVPGLLYPESSDFTKRNRFMAWKAAVETSRSVEQLALQVRELDANIRWDEIENTQKREQYKYSVKSFKKVTVRKKLTEGTVVKYLLDFGKKRFLPDIVVTHGSIVEESSGGRKKYWLEETHVPLHLLKTYEERRIARKCNKMNPGKNHLSDRLTKRTTKRKGFSYLFARAERSTHYQCGHCNKDVLISEAVCCLICKDFFHKRHAKKSPGATAAVYTCHKCLSGKVVKSGAKKGKKSVSTKSKNNAVGSKELRPKTKKKACKVTKSAQKQKNKKNNTVVLPLRRSPRKIKCATLQKKKAGRPKKGKAKGKGKQIKSTKAVPKQRQKSVWQDNRTLVRYAYWLDGIRFSRKPHDERVVPFKEKSLVTPLSLPTVSMVSPPKCSLCCEEDFSPFLSYFRCEICEDWFHRDAFGIAGEKLDSIIGFKCHKCRGKTSPICPYLHKKTKTEPKSREVNTCDGDNSIPNSEEEERKEAVSKEVDDFLAENTTEAMETD